MKLSRQKILDILKKENLEPQVIQHVLAVEALALAWTDLIKQGNPELNINAELISFGALLHDLGRAVTHSIQHAVEGVKLARKYTNDSNLLHIIERHIGAGISAEEALLLSLPEKNYIPKSYEEKIVAHADNLIGGDQRRRLEFLIKRLENQGAHQAIQRLLALHQELCELAKTDLDKSSI